MSRLELPAAHQLLSGYGPPPSGSALEPVTAYNDPWRWSPSFLSWMSAPVDVSWEAGATIPAFAPPAAGTLTVFLGPTGDNPFDIVSAGEHPFGAPASTLSTTSGVLTYGPSEPATAAAAGSGTAFVSWYLFPETFAETPAYTATRDDVLPVESRTIADILGPDFTIAPNEWNDTAIGQVGDFYIDMGSVGLDLYGPRSEFAWGTPVAQLAPVLLSPDGTPFRLVVANDGTLSTDPV